MKLNTGRTSIKIEFDNGDVDYIYINPSDPNLALRMRDFGHNLNKRMKNLEDMSLDYEGKPADEKMLDIFEKIQNNLYSELDVALGSEASKVIFKHCSAFATVGGEYYIVQALQTLFPEITRMATEAKNKADKKIMKHVEKYAK